VLAGTPIADVTEAIEPENILRLRRLAEWDNVAWNSVFSPDGSLVASAEIIAPLNALTVRHTDDGSVLFAVEEERIIHDLAFLTDGSALAIAGADDLRFRDPADGTLSKKPGYRILGLGPLNIAVSPDGQHLAAAWPDGTIRVFCLDDMQPVKTLSCVSESGNLAYSPSGEVFAAGGCGGSVRIWSTTEYTLEHSLPGNFFAFSPDGIHLASSSLGGSTRVWEIETGEAVAELPGWGIAYSPDGRILATVSTDWAYLWDTSDYSRLRTIDSGGYPLVKAVFSPDGSLLAITASPGPLRLWGILP
jgi:hypothetical protein